MSGYYDLVIIGGGLAGATLARAMSASGTSVLVLEAATEFKDRIWGDLLVPWGVSEAESLDLRGMLEGAGAVQIRWRDQYIGSEQTEHRDLIATTLTENPLLAFYNPRLQDIVLNAAQASGAEVRRGIIANSVLPGRHPRVEFFLPGGQEEEVDTRMVVVADGRNSRFRRLPGSKVQRETHTLCVAGVLLASVPLSPDTYCVFMNPQLGELVIWIPQGENRVQTYLIYWGEKKRRFKGAADVPRLLEAMEWTRRVGDYFASAVPIGPLATFEGADTWVEFPYASGVALLGDAAASNDPAWGQGLALALRGVRALKNSLLGNTDWDVSGKVYAYEQGSVYQSVRSVAGWSRELFLGQGAEADQRRARAFPLITKDPSRVPDVLISGPDAPLPPDARARFYGEDVKAAVAM
jgi:2-polyprenyl-6-methoxyphenol hydroxylase-like FAD-dependent oxidoreductase